jgi:RecB family exonuclease
MPDLTLFASERFPLRASRLYWFMCQMRHALEHLGHFGPDAGGVAAQTGSLTHAGIQAWHDRGRDTEEALRAMRAAAPRFPAAEPPEAQRNLLLYAKDPRNQAAKVVATEQPVTLRLPDPGGDVVVRGTLDQIREDDDGVWRVYDVKTGGGQKSAEDMLYEAALQVCAYAVAATAHFARPVEPGCIIWTCGYRRRGVEPAAAPGGVFLPFNLSLPQAEALVHGVRQLAAAVRRGAPAFGPGSWCNFCPARGLRNCLRLYQRAVEDADRPPAQGWKPAALPVIDFARSWSWRGVK